jgi:hypothetical protein
MYNVDDDSIRHPEADLELSILNEIVKSEKKGNYEGKILPLS